MFTDDDLIMISALEHYSYCPRQCGLIHVEQVYDENVFTLRGRSVHERAHQDTTRMEGGIRVERGLPIWSDRLGLTGVADVVEFHADGRVYPVEYKHGQRRRHVHAAVQLCAQAICLEEMLGVVVRAGAVYASESRRRSEIALDDSMRARVAELTVAIREMRRTGHLPPPVNDSRCPNCSLIDACLPAAGRAAAHAAARAVWRIPPEEGFG